jgi:diguanylate cyclase (GGDEF)-like protein/PAS domain S-box-containing protein
MLTTQSIIIFLLLISGLISIFTLVTVITRGKNIRGGVMLHLFLIGVIIWDTTYAIHWMVQTSALKAFWLDMTYVGVVTVPGTMLIFMIKYLGEDAWLKPSRLILLAAEPVLTLIILFTDPLHGWFYGGMRHPMQSQILEGGVWFWVNVVYQYALILLVILILIQAIGKKSQLFHRQAIWIAVGVSFPFVGNLFTFLGINPLSGLDLTPITFAFTGLIISSAIIFYGLFDLIPVGRDILVETMPDGMLLLDNDRRLIDINPAARRILNLPADGLVGQPIHEILNGIPGLDGLFESDGPKSIELQIREPKLRYLSIRSQVVRERPTGQLGNLLICRDITEQKTNEIRLREQYEEITLLQVTLSEQAIRDPLTSLYNRRYLYETLPREIARTERDGTSMCVVILDMDNFKMVNDTFGHTAGDQVLIELSRYLERNTRQGDMVVRYGGEEFLITLSNTPADAAYLRVEEWLTYFATTDITFGEARIRSTFSAGIAVFPGDGVTSDQLINQADTLLYQAKAGGKSRIKLLHEVHS